MEANTLIRRAKALASIPLTFPSSTKPEELELGVFSDAAWANRRNGESQGGRLLLLGSKEFWKGSLAAFSVIGWKSG